MFNPRGTLPPRPRGPNPSGSKPPGSFGGGGAAGPQRKPAPGAPQAAPQRPPGQDSLQWTGSQRINVRVTLHRADPRKVKEKSSLHQEQKGDPRPNRWDSGPCPAGTAAPKPPAPVPVLEQNSSAQNRYTPESASSILASFGLSNEDLEELSRYPDDQLTPENMPRILREIRIRKMGQPVPGLRAPARGDERGAEPGAAVKGKVIDYGHASKYGYTEDPLEVCPYGPEGLPEPALEACVYNAEGPGAEGREDVPREQSVPVPGPPPAVPCNPVFPADDLMKLPGFQGDSSGAPPFFPAEPPAKVSGLCPAPAALPVVTPVSQAPMPPVLPPMMPALLPTPLAQPLLPPVMPPLVQPPVSQHVLPPMTPPPFSAGLLAAISQHEQKQRDSGSGSGNSGRSGGGHKGFHSEGPIKSPFGVVKASWLPVFSDSQKSKRLPTPSMMNDYYATSPRIFPHLCSLCNLECTQMKDWILHQNNPSHIESCRKLRQQYPEWNPEAHSSSRTAGDRKENQTPKHRSSSSSPSRRRYRPGGSGYPLRRFRSRSRSPGRFRRPRSRSPPRYPRRPSPRHRSRSPQRPRGSLRPGSRSHRSSSSERSSRRSSRSEDRKAALEAVMKTLGPEFLAEFKKHKSLQAAVQGSLGSGRSSSTHGPPGKVSGSVKKPLKTSAAPKAPKKDGSAAPGPSSASAKTEESAQNKEGEEDEEDESAGSSKPQSASYNRLLREDLLSCGTVLQISDLPDDGFSDQDIKKLVQPFGKVSDLIVLRSRNEAYLEMNYKEAVIAAVKFGETQPVLLNGKRIRISVAEKPRAPPGQVKKTIKKRVLTVKKTSASTKKVPTTSTKTPKPPTGKKEKLKKSAVPGERKVKKPPGAAEPAEDGDAEPSAEPGVGAEGAEPSDPKSVPEEDGTPEPAVPMESQPHPSPVPEPPGTGTLGEESTDPARKDPEDLCVVLVSNLPNKGYSVEEVSNLAKPFGGLKDMLILSSHKKAYLEINRKAADSMVKFYTCFPMSLDGKQLSISMVPQYQTVRDEEAIFTALIKDSDPQVNTESIHNQFVHLGNLPDDGYRELEVVCVGLRFGKVDHYVVLKNKNKAILQLDTPRSARSMHSFLQQYPYSMGEHTLSCSLSPRGDPAQAEAGKRDPKREEGSRASAGSKKSPEGSGVVPRAAADPPGEPRGAKRGATPASSGTEEIPAGQTEPPEPQPGGAARESPGSLARTAVEDVDTGIGVPVKPAGTRSPAERWEEKPLPPSSAGTEEAPKGPPEPKLLEKGSKEGDEESSAPAMEALGSSSRAEGDPAGRGVIPAAGEPAGASPGAASPRDEGAPMDTLSPAVTQPASELAAPGKSPVPEAGKSNPETSGAPVAERRPVPKTREAPGKRLDVAGAEEGVLKAGHAAEENPGKLLGKAGAELEKQLGKAAAKAGAALEDAPSAVGGSSAGSSAKSHQNKGTGAANPDRSHPGAPLSPFLSLKEPAVGKTLLRAVVSIPDIFKARPPAKSSEPSPGKGGEQNPPRAEGQAGGDKRTPSKAAQPAAGSGQGRGSGSSTVDGQGGSGRSSSQQEKDSQVESRAGSKQSQEGESGTPCTEEDPGSTQGPGGDRTSGAGSSGKQKEEEELFPFNLDEFVTVDEVVEEVESPVVPRRNPPRGKRKEGAKPSPSEPASKRRKGKSSGAKGEPSFVTLDEIGEEEDAPAPPGDPQGLLVVDEVLEEEELSEAVKDPQALLTLDEISEQEEPGAPRDLPQPAFKERDLKAEPLVTVDEIGEVEELPLNEPTELGGEEGKAGAADFASSQVPDDPTALVTVDEIQEDNEDNPLVTLDEVNEEEDDFLADFNHLKEELNFVTVDEVGDEEEEEENASPGKSAHKDEEEEDIVAVAGPEEEEIAASAGPEEEDIVAVAGPEEIGILGDPNPEEEISAVSKPKAAQLGSGGAEPEPKQKKALGVPRMQSTPKGKPRGTTPNSPGFPALDILVPKAGFFCQICSLFYADEPSMIQHCRTPLHRHNMEKFMAKQQDNDGEEPSSR
ncbi:zinc finger protein 638 isoform X1 [Manacus candei]|uniref:zinc finger protein 638 isoform X1 n=1 Tax=Manacus candei TaxID=415023 RepID=UPI00222688B6|nr:zinc finger protein 638 isoform X1 [Manacus candei]XP_051630812.1 zinc finger protein 638 isoform X1 [Manacus candei]XP_051630813.1 zinc finger protein 638 isoform X1 [Manacus candei]